METREFREHDWLAFAGAEGWPGQDATLPLFGTGTLEDGKEYVVVLDRTGGCLLVEDDPQNDYGGQVLELPFPTQTSARIFATGLGEPKHVLDFLLAGFKPI